MKPQSHLVSTAERIFHQSGTSEAATHLFSRTHSIASLLDPIQFGDIHLPSWVIMAPLTRLDLCTKGIVAGQGACAAGKDPCLGPTDASPSHRDWTGSGVPEPHGRAVHQTESIIETAKALGFKSTQGLCLLHSEEETRASRAKSVARFAPWWVRSRQEIQTCVLA
jgi:hypothetical protein